MKWFTFGWGSKTQHEVSTSHFGAVYTTFHGLSAFDAQREALGVSDVRWPGGRRGETTRDVNDVDGDGDRTEYLYDLAHDDVLLVPKKGLSDLFSYAQGEGAEVTLFLPSLRYLGRPGDAARDARAFAERLSNGDFGDVPKLTIELGSETLNGSQARAAAYGAVANAQMGALRSALDESLDVDIAVQIGRSAAEDRTIRSAFTRENLAEIDALVAHHLPINIRNHNRTLDDGQSRFSRTSEFASDWEAGVRAAGGPGDLDLLITAWTVGPSSRTSLSELAWQDIGARQGRTTLDTFAQLIGAGADAMHVWGVDARSNPNAFSQPSEGGVALTHGGAVFAMMAESLPGMSLHEGYQQPWTATGAPEEPVWVYAFEDADKYILFVAANEIEAPETIVLRLSSVDEGRAVEVLSVSTELSETTPKWATGHAERLYEEPRLGQSRVIVEGNRFEFTVGDAFDVHRLTVWKDGAPTSDDPAAPLMNGSDVFQVVAPGQAGETSDDLASNRFFDPTMEDDFLF